MSDINIPYKNNLKAILKAEGIPQAKLARVTELSVTTINKVTNQRRGVSETTQFRIVRGINRLIKELYKEDRTYKVEEVFPERKEAE